MLKVKSLLSNLLTAFFTVVGITETVLAEFTEEISLSGAVWSQGCVDVNVFGLKTVWM